MQKGFAKHGFKNHHEKELFVWNFLVQKICEKMT